MTKILNLIVAEQAEYQVLKFAMGKNNLVPSHLEIEVRCDSAEKLAMLTTKLIDRGSAQAIGVVTDVGLFVRSLAEKLGVM